MQPASSNRKDGNLQRRTSSEGLIAQTGTGPQRKRVDQHTEQEVDNDYDYGEHITIPLSMPLSKCLAMISSQKCGICNTTNYASSWSIFQDQVQVFLGCDECYDASMFSYHHIIDLTDGIQIEPNAYRLAMLILSSPETSFQSTIDTLGAFGISIPTRMFFQAMTRISEICVEVCRNSLEQLKQMILKLIEEEVFENDAIEERITNKASNILIASGPPLIKNRLLIEDSIQKSRINKRVPFNHHAYYNQRRVAAMDHIIELSLSPIMKLLVYQDKANWETFGEYIAIALPSLNPEDLCNRFKKNVAQLFYGDNLNGIEDLMAQFLLRCIKIASATMEILYEKASFEIFAHHLDQLIPHFQSLRCSDDCLCHQPHREIWATSETEVPKILLPIYRANDESPEATAHRTKLETLKKVIDDYKEQSFHYIHGSSIYASEYITYQKPKQHTLKDFDIWKLHALVGARNLGFVNFWTQVILKLDSEIDEYRDFLSVMQNKDLELMTSLQKKRNLTQLIRQFYINNKLVANNEEPDEDD